MGPTARGLGCGGPPLVIFLFLLIAASTFTNANDDIELDLDRDGDGDVKIHFNKENSAIIFQNEIFRRGLKKIKETIQVEGFEKVLAGSAVDL